MAPARACYFPRDASRAAILFAPAVTTPFRTVSDSGSWFLMDIKRNLLILALAVVSYLMLLEWNEDYAVTVPPSTATTPALPETTAARKSCAIH